MSDVESESDLLNGRDLDNALNFGDGVNLEEVLTPPEAVVPEEVVPQEDQQPIEDIMSPESDASKFAGMQTIKPPTPRHLDDKETHVTLKQWKTNCLTYFRRCLYNWHFTRASTKWKPGTANYSLTAETVGLKRTPDILADDLVQFMNLFGGFLPDGYLTERFQASTTCFEDMWKIVEEYYDATLSSSSFLDITQLKKEDKETYRMFYERLVDHIRIHLTPAGTEVGGLVTPDGGDKINIKNKIFQINLKNKIFLSTSSTAKTTWMEWAL